MTFLSLETQIQIIKGLDIAYISVIQFTFAILMNIGFEEFLFLCMMIAVLVSFAYLGRKIIRKIPSPFHLIKGFRHDTLPELGDIAAITGFILLTSGYVETRIKKIRNYFGLGTQFYDIEKEPKQTGHATNK